MRKIASRIKAKLIQSTTKVRWMLLTKTERKMMGISATITQEFTRSRTFRRTMEGTPLGDVIKNTLNNWDNERAR
jgi:hypothetical protein